MNLHGPRPRVPRIRVRLATLADLDLLVRHRRRMWEAISDIPEDLLDAADPVYRRWARTRMRTGRLVGLIVEDDGEPGAGGGAGGERVRVAHARPAAAALERLDVRVSAFDVHGTGSSRKGPCDSRRAR